MSHGFSRYVIIFRGRTTPEEGFLVGYSSLIEIIESRLEMALPLPDVLAIAVDLLIKFLDQNGGKLSKKKRDKHFEELGDVEIRSIEEAFRDIFMES